ncbi:hypothetical protein ACHAXT_005741 [Thalassiosira profunda]
MCSSAMKASPTKRAAPSSPSSSKEHAAPSGTTTSLVNRGILALLSLYIAGNILSHLHSHMISGDEDAEVEDIATRRVEEYQFPSVEQRFRYYMGDWFNKTEWEGEECPPRSHSHQINMNADAIISLQALQECSLSKSSAIPAQHYYCKDAYDTLRRAATADNSTSAMFLFGDSSNPNSHPLPLISKARMGVAEDIPVGMQPIIWPLNINRHYRDVETYHNNYVLNETEVPWEEKLPTVVWRGTVTGQRVQKLKSWLNHDPSVVDVGFTDIPPYKKNRFAAEHVPIREKMDLGEMSRYKYLLSVEGNDVATGLKWMLYSNSVVMMPNPTKATWAMEDLLQPWVHYIPLADNFSNLLEMVAWAEGNQEECQQIAARATDFMVNLCLTEQAHKDHEQLKKMLATAYVNQFSEQLARCDVSASDGEQGGVQQSLRSDSEPAIDNEQPNNDGGARDDQGWVNADCFCPLAHPILGKKAAGIPERPGIPKLINVGFPKCGSTTLDIFLCSSPVVKSSSHWTCSLPESKKDKEESPWGGEYCGRCIRHAISNGLPLFQTCGDFATYTQMDYISDDPYRGTPGHAEGECIFPQISHLEEIYAEEPGAIFILPFRNVSSWIRSVTNFHGMGRRFAKFCDFPEYNFTSKTPNLESFYCNHVKHVRRFVAEHPSLTLVEYAIDREDAGDYLSGALPGFQLNGSNYGHQNALMTEVQASVR